MNHRTQQNAEARPPPFVARLSRPSSKGIRRYSDSERWLAGTLKGKSPPWFYLLHCHTLMCARNHVVIVLGSAIDLLFSLTSLQVHVYVAAFGPALRRYLNICRESDDNLRVTRVALDIL
jgi:hypothetical protein